MRAFAPAFECFIYRRCGGLISHTRWQIIILSASYLVTYADFKFFEAVKDIKLCQSHTMYSVNCDRLAHQNGVKPAAAPFTSCDDAEFLTDCAKMNAHLVV